MSFYAYDHTLVNISIFNNLIFKQISVNRFSDEIDFITDSGVTFKMCHHQDCCESVHISEIIGDLNDLLDTPILEASERTKDPKEMRAGLLCDNSYDESETWTFYSLRTIKGSVTLRWYGSSNGYYSESVDIYQCKP